MKVLFISPTPTHPLNAGNRVHIFSLINFFKSKGFEVYMLYLAFEGYDEVAMNDFLQGRLFTIKSEELFKRRNWLQGLTSKIYFKSQNAKRYFQLKTGKISKEEFLYNSELDIHFPLSAKKLIKNLEKKYKFDIVICEYVFISKALEILNSSALKILDTHDRFTNRFCEILKQGLKPNWISLYKDQEQKGINRAELIIAIQENEKHYFQTLTNKPITTYSDIIVPELSMQRKFEKKLMYFASDNLNNQASLKYFIEQIFPLILNNEPHVILLVGGSICKAGQLQHPNIKYLGEFENSCSFYTKGDIVINPEISGTGLKIKTMEALAYGMPVIATHSGAMGLTEPNMDHILVADTAQIFAAHVLNVLIDDVKRNQLSKNAIEWIKIFRQKCLADLTESVERGLIGK